MSWIIFFFHPLSKQRDGQPSLPSLSGSPAADVSSRMRVNCDSWPRNYFESLTIPKNQPLTHINLGWGLWAGRACKVRSFKLKRSNIPICLKIFYSISQPNVNGFKLSIHQIKKLSKQVKIWCCMLKCVHVWQHSILGNVRHLVRGSDRYVRHKF